MLLVKLDISNNTKTNNHYALGLYGLSESLQAKSVALIS